MVKVIISLLVLGLFLLFMVFFVWIFAMNIRALQRMSKERKVFQKMMRYICDATVLSYIDYFEKSYGFLSGLLNTNRAVAHRNDLTRQAQGWELIKNSNNVSNETKEKLKTAFISKGVPLKNI